MRPLVQKARIVARLRPHDTSTEEGRANERYRRAFLTASAFGFSKVVSMATLFISYPLTLHYLGPQRFGLWVTLSSLIVLLAFADFGIGNGLLNSVAEAHGRDDRVAIRGAVSSALAVLTTIGLTIVVGFSIVAPFISWADVFNVKTALAQSEVGPALRVLICCFALNIPAGVVQRTQLGLQMGFLENLWQSAGNLVALMAVLVVIRLQLGLPWLVGAVAGVPALMTMCNGFVFFHKFRDIAPSLAAVSRRTMKSVAHTGMLFLVLQVAVSGAYASDSIVISRVLGPEAVPQFAVPDKMFSVIPLGLGMLLMPLWPAYGEAAARGDGRWVRQVFVRSLKIAIAFSATFACVFVLLGKYILTAWMGRSVEPPFALLVGMGLWKIFEATGIAIAAFLNGTNTVRLQAILAVMMASAAIILKTYFAGRFGVTGVVWGTLTAFVTFTFIPFAIFVPKIVARYR